MNPVDLRGWLTANRPSMAGLSWTEQKGARWGWAIGLGLSPLAPVGKLHAVTRRNGALKLTWRPIIIKPSLSPLEELEGQFLIQYGCTSIHIRLCWLIALVRTTIRKNKIKCDDGGWRRITTAEKTSPRIRYSSLFPLWLATSAVNSCFEMFWFALFQCYHRTEYCGTAGIWVSKSSPLYLE